MSDKGSVSTTLPSRLPMRQVNASKSWLQRQRPDVWPFLLPALFFYGIFVLYPIINALVLSFFNWDGISPNRTFVGLSNYAFVLTEDRVFWTSLRNSATWTGLSLLVPTTLGLVLAVALNLPLVGRAVIRTAIYLPAVLATVIVATMWSWMYNPTLGLVNATLESLGLADWIQDWLGSERVVLFSVFVASVWQVTGTNMLLFLAGVQRIDQELIEAAKVDGADDLRVFWFVTLPGLRQTFIVVISLTIINALKVFDLVYAMTYGGPGQASQVLASWSYFQAFNFHNFGIGTSIAMILFAITLLIIVPYIRWMAREDEK